MKKVLALVAVAGILAGCDVQPNSTQIERKKQEEMNMQAVTQVGMPSIVNFAEKRMMKDILELRDQNVATTTYLVDMNGKLHKVCNSVGYGLPYATQYTNPSLADPNGLYTPSSADGTWVLCLNPKTKKVDPQYVEPRVIVMTYPLQ